MKKALATLLMTMLFGISYATDYRNDVYQYSMEYTGFGRNENVLVTVTFMCDSPAQAEASVKPLAVHAVLFIENAPHPGTYAQKELVPKESMTSEAEKYFDKFFADKEYEKYVTSVGIENMIISKVKKKYQITIQVSVDKQNLRKELEKQKIIKSLDQVFNNEN